MEALFIGSGTTFHLINYYVPPNNGNGYQIKSCVCGEDSDRSLHFATGDVDKGCLEIVVKLASLLPESLPVFPAPSQFSDFPLLQ